MSFSPIFKRDMKNLVISTIISIVTSFLICCCCSSESYSASGKNSIYYWRTTFTLNDAERDFLKDHDITKIYVKFFDVECDWKQGTGYVVTPEATINFIDSVPDGIEVVPTVYITSYAMENMQLHEDGFAEKIYKRINAMCRRNGIDLKEIQLDCDWTKGTREPFFKLCGELKSLMAPTQTLSSTIRLHQLTQSPPPVDKGVLMVYNTGNLMEMTTDNSIFSRRDIEPYLRNNRLAKYDLPLDVAYPTYGWSVVYHPGAGQYSGKYFFDRLMRRTDFSGYPGLKKINANTFEAEQDINFSPDSTRWDGVYKSYRIRVERPTANEILEVKSMIDNQLSNKPHTNILYHLDESQFKHYSDHDINKIYSRN